MAEAGGRQTDAADVLAELACCPLQLRGSAPGITAATHHQACICSCDVLYSDIRTVLFPVRILADGRRSEILRISQPALPVW